MAVKRKILVPSDSMAYAHGLPDWSNMAVIEQWRYSSSTNASDDYYILNSSNKNVLESLKKTIVVNTDGTAGADTVDDIITTDHDYGKTTYIYRAVAPCYLCQLSKVDESSAHSDCVCVVGDSIAALTDGNDATYSNNRAILSMNIDGTYGGNWIVPIIPKTDNFYFRFGALSSCYLELCIVPIYGSGMTGKQCYRNTKTRGTNTVAYYYTKRTYLSNVIKNL